MPELDNSLASRVAELAVEVRNLTTQYTKIDTKLETISVQLNMVPIHAVRIDNLELAMNKLDTRTADATHGLDTRLTAVCKQMDQAAGAWKIVAIVTSILTSIVSGTAVWFITTHFK